MTDDVGTVYLVGAGPGDPELLTVKASRLIDRADVVLHDSLVGNSIIDEMLTKSTSVTHVGKAGGGRRWSQSEINQYMVEMAHEWETVVRLKGGDPCVFGRGGEEAEFLTENDIPFEIVPGVTSAIAAPGSVGIPVTHRDVASSVTVITGHAAADKTGEPVDWSCFARQISRGETLVVLMGVSRLPEYVSALRQQGVSGKKPVAMIEKATWENERTVVATLDTIVDAAGAADVEPPATTVIGDVVSVPERVRSLQRSMPVQL